MADREKPAMTEDEIETTAWALETKMMEIRKDPRAALTAGLARIRATMLAKVQAWWAKKQAEIEEEWAKRRAKREEEWTKRCAQREEEWAKWCAQREAEMAKLEAEWARSSASAELRAAFADFIRLRQREAAEPVPPVLQ
jgi:hypothetical protein